VYQQKTARDAADLKELRGDFRCDGFRQHQNWGRLLRCPTPLRGARLLNRFAPSRRPYLTIELALVIIIRIKVEGCRVECASERGKPSGGSATRCNRRVSNKERERQINHVLRC
jgi:hypothetical protein